MLLRILPHKTIKQDIFNDVTLWGCSLCVCSLPALSCEFASVDVSDVLGTVSFFFTVYLESMNRSVLSFIDFRV